MLPQVRSFNRTVTERVGALVDDYLSRGRPLGASRLLWELDAPTDVRALRRRLGLDSGYMSRLLRGLEAEGLVRVETDTADRRLRRVTLTPAGTRERAELDARSDALAASLLAPLSERRRAELVEAMSTVERLLTAGLVEIAPDDGETAAWCVRQYFDELHARFGFEPGQTGSHDGAVFLVARLRGEPVGCVGLKGADIKRMWVAPSVRGLGVGRRLLSELEARARANGLTHVRLETGGALKEAQALYRSSGYVEVPPFNDEPFADHWFEKRLGDPRSDLQAEMGTRRRSRPRT
jgi:DNA-binding MarR family transcriptional regulator